MLLSLSYSDVDIEAQFSINQSRADEITMREDYGNLPMTIHDDGFGDIGFDSDEPAFIRDDVDTAIDVSLMKREKKNEIPIERCKVWHVISINSLRIPGKFDK